jgi:UDP-N-acetylmuramoyl-L-alanyl-D-glutamate--2,6-diaminopimelate ligase
MTLGELIAGSPAGARLGSGQDGSRAISGLSYDSRAVGAGELFFCVSGFRADGHDFAERAVRAGAAALVVERRLHTGVPEVLVPSARAAMAPLAARFFGEPSKQLTVLGVTGTNGKTTTTFLARALLEACPPPLGGPSGLLGTVKSVIAGSEVPVARTTPEAIELQGDLRAMLDGGDRACAIEVSSHALELHRTDAIEFAAAVFTNLTQDHLDFHPTMEDYFLAKRALFLPAAGAPPRAQVVNVADPFGRRLAGELDAAITFGVEVDADYRASGLSCGFERCRFRLHTPAGEHELDLPMPGRFNVSNALAALAAVHALGGPLEPLIAALERGVRVPGRFEPVEEGQDFAVLVDYAHTPDSLENVLRAARELAGAASVICVFGAGGDRDKGKRPLMGEAVAALADIAIVTSDNPRSEEPDQIIAEVMEGARARAVATQAPAAGAAGAGPRARVVRAIADRREAIATATREAAHGDVLVIAGKGHEQGQEFADGRKVPFDDVAVAREALRALARAPLQGAGAA